MKKKDNLYSLYRTFNLHFYNYFVAPKRFPKIKDNLSKYHIKSINYTLDKLITTNASISRFGDGEISWIFNQKNNPDDFEMVSKKLSKRLREVIKSDNENFMIGLPDTFRSIDNLTRAPRKFWIAYLLKNHKRINSLLSTEKTYYNTSITRPYIDYKDNRMAKYAFDKLKRIWDGKNILIIEGNESRLGYRNDLFSNANDITRIECPSRNAFEKYDDILSCALEFLQRNPDYLTLISLGPTATILAYDLFKMGHRAIDIGHVDIEYEWYLIGAKERVDLPYKYVNEVLNGHYAQNISDNKFEKEIYKEIGK
ncbi:SP_1767 family glycosyltransferase [Apilactobacillus timberlakei]|uniref:SP_1767 family glycosyltransferase n=1 Tax=Apilactobacillus timberlakei TaxID=2008380 RepID=UPI001127DD61|nr:SP_1767 family glycosyltransferase [Apilactobacillus timberlakei]TPR24952.1 SP_1767 family glycosyltransferase [Apilactobacillus timberlakei]